MSVQSDFEEFASYLDEAKRQRDHWKARALSAERKLSEIAALDQWNPKFVQKLTESPSENLGCKPEIIWVCKLADIKRILEGDNGKV